MTEKKTLSKTDEKAIEKAQKNLAVCKAFRAKKAEADKNGKCPAYNFNSEVRELSPKHHDKDLEEDVAQLDHVLNLTRVLNVTRTNAARMLSESLISASGNDSKVATELNGAIALMEQIAPKDPIESMLALQMIATHNMAMELVGLARQNTSKTYFEEFARHAERTLRIYSQQAAIFGKYRNGGKQTVEVKHVNVESGGQAIIGDVKTG